MKYKHLFFDLDLTLWDFDKNSDEVLVELFSEFNLEDAGITDTENFIAVYKIHNEQLWDSYRKGIVSKEELRTVRFYKVLQDFGIDNKKLANDISEGYLKKGPYKTHLMPYTIDTLEYLSIKYKLHIITNGFDEIQLIKLNNCGIRKYFEQIITSDSTGFKKPDKRIFHHSLYKAKAKTKQSIMIGDHLEIDIVGARNAGLDQIYFNPKGKKHNESITYEINCLKKLMSIF